MKKAIKHLSRDPVMKKLIKKHGELSLWEEENDLFVDLLYTIINQQLSDKAASTIGARFEKLFKAGITPKTLLKLKDDKIRECGISYPKIKYMKGIAEAIVKGELDLEGLKKMSDEEVKNELIKLKGIGAWSAEMILMFSLKREDLFSVGDLGLRTAVANLYGVSRDDNEAIEKIALAWKPYRTIACRYLWKSLG